MKNNALDYDPYTGQYEAEFTLMRWFDDIQRDFASRADWCISNIYEEANHAPTVAIQEGTDLKASPGERIILHAKGQDPDGDNLTYR